MNLSDMEEAVTRWVAEAPERRAVHVEDEDLRQTWTFFEKGVQVGNIRGAVTWADGVTVWRWSPSHRMKSLIGTP